MTRFKLSDDTKTMGEVKRTYEWDVSEHPVKHASSCCIVKLTICD